MDTRANQWDSNLRLLQKPLGKRFLFSPWGCWAGRTWVWIWRWPNAHPKLPWEGSQHEEGSRAERQRPDGATQSPRPGLKPAHPGLIGFMRQHTFLLKPFSVELLLITRKRALQWLQIPSFLWQWLHLSGALSPCLHSNSSFYSQIHMSNPSWTLHLGVHFNMGLNVNSNYAPTHPLPVSTSQWIIVPLPTQLSKKPGPHRWHFVPSFPGLVWAANSGSFLRAQLLGCVIREAFSNLQAWMKGPSYAPIPACTSSVIALVTQSPNSLWILIHIPHETKFWDSQALPGNQYYLNKWTLGYTRMILYIIDSPFFCKNQICRHFRKIHKGHGVWQRRLSLPGAPVPSWQ